MKISISEAELIGTIRKCLSEAIDNAAYQMGYADNRGNHIPYSEIRYQSKFQTNNKKPRALSVLVLKIIVDSYCKEVKLIRNNQDKLVRVIKKIRQDKLPQGYKEIMYQDPKAGKTHVLLNFKEPHQPMYQFYIKYDTNGQNDDVDRNNFDGRKFYEWLVSKNIKLEKPKRPRIVRNDTTNIHTNWDMMDNPNNIRRWNRMREK